MLICHRKQIPCFSFCLHLKYFKYKITAFHIFLFFLLHRHILSTICNTRIYIILQKASADFFLRKPMTVQNNLEHWDIFYIKYSESQEKCLENHKLCLHKELKHLGDKHCFFFQFKILQDYSCQEGRGYFVGKKIQTNFQQGKYNVYSRHCIFFLSGQET